MFLDMSDLVLYWIFKVQLMFLVFFWVEKKKIGGVENQPTPSVYLPLLSSQTSVRLWLVSLVWVSLQSRRWWVQTPALLVTVQVPNRRNNVFIMLIEWFYANEFFLL